MILYENYSFGKGIGIFFFVVVICMIDINEVRYKNIYWDVILDELFIFCVY